MHGTIAHYTLTPKGDVDGFLLADGTQVHLPPHLSTAPVATAGPGDAVAVAGRRERESPVIEASEVRNGSDGTVVATGPGGKKPTARGDFTSPAR